MKKHKRALLLAAIVLEVLLIVQLRQYEPNWNRWPALTVLLALEVFGIQLLDVFLGILALAFAGLIWQHSTPPRTGTYLEGRGRAGVGGAHASPEVLNRTKAPSTKDHRR